MSYNATTLTTTEALMLQQVLVDELQSGAADSQGTVAARQLALAQLRAHIANMSVPLAFSAASATMAQSAIERAPHIIKTSAPLVSVRQKLTTK